MKKRGIQDKKLEKEEIQEEGEIRRGGVCGGGGEVRHQRSRRRKGERDHKKKTRKKEEEDFRKWQGVKE